MIGTRQLLALHVCALALCAAILLPETSRSQGGGDFDHAETRFPLTGSHRREPCESCHLEGLFKGTPTRCEMCHDGSGLRALTAKTLDHVPSSNRCDDCHDSVLWSRAIFDHADVSGRCSSCHDGFRATGKHMNHVITTSDCGACHTTLRWVPARFDHSGVTACFTCHNGVTATGKDPGHFVTTSDCDACHNTRNWDNTFFRHTSAFYPGEHRQNLDCNDCHFANNEAVNWTSPGYARSCAGCHAQDYKPDPHKKVDSPRILYTVSELRDCTTACHQYTDATFQTIEKSRPNEHRVGDGDF